MTVFNEYLNNLTNHETVPPVLMGGIGNGGLADKFASRFGTSWNRTPVKGVYAIWSDGAQFTCREEPNGNLDIRLHQYATPKDFKKAFEQGPFSEGVKITWEMGGMYKYPYLPCWEALVKLGLSKG